MSVRKVSCSVVGGRGYTGIEVSRLLLSHPQVQFTHCFATSEFKLSSFLPEGRAQVVCLRDTEVMNNLTDVVFLATPAEVSLDLAPKIVAQGKTVIDLSGAFRLKKNSYGQWYGFEHTEAKALAQATYGLVPWAGPVASEKLIANPGCYASAVTMALIPVLKNNLIEEQGIVIDAKSGTTGAGKKASENLLFSEVEGECLPYKVGRHQHLPEIVEAVELFSGKSIDPHFTTSLLPVRRGIIAGIYAQLKTGITLKDVTEAFSVAYGGYPLVGFGPLEKEPALMSLRKVVGTAKTHISYDVVGQKLYLFSCLDNLLKGAASQAIENLNRISDLPLGLGVGSLEAFT